MSGSVTFQDVTLDISWEEWKLLDESQRLLYHDVMLDNFALLPDWVSSLHFPRLLAWAPSLFPRSYCASYGHL